MLVCNLKNISYNNSIKHLYKIHTLQKKEIFLNIMQKKTSDTWNKRKPSKVFKYIYNRIKIECIGNVVL